MQFAMEHSKRSYVNLGVNLKSRDLRSFDIRFEFESDVPIRIRFESELPIRKFRIGRICCVPSYHKLRSLTDSISYTTQEEARLINMFINFVYVIKFSCHHSLTVRSD